MTEYVQVKDKNNLIRDIHSNAIVNNNKSAYELAKKRAEDAQKQIDAGADLIQLITGMIFEGPQVIGEINKGIYEQT